MLVEFVLLESVDLTLLLAFEQVRSGLDSEHVEHSLPRVHDPLGFFPRVAVSVGREVRSDRHNAEALVVGVVEMLGFHVRDSSKTGFGLKHKSRKVLHVVSA